MARQSVRAPGKGDEMKTPEDLANEHWDWVEGFWESLPDENKKYLVTIEYLYKTAFIHGFKHGWRGAKSIVEGELGR